MMCRHWWRSHYEGNYGWVSVCEICGQRESGEHSDECMYRMTYHEGECRCGAQRDFDKYERTKGAA